MKLSDLFLCRQGQTGSEIERDVPSNGAGEKEECVKGDVEAHERGLLSKPWD